MKLGTPTVLFAFAISLSATPYGNLPVNFEPNIGQSESTARYVARGNGYTLQLRPESARILLHKAGQQSDVCMRLVGANSSAPMESAKPLPGRASYFHGNDPAKWLTGISTFAEVRATGVYPGIDMVYYGNQTRLEYDFVVAPGADPGRIRLKFEGIGSIRRDALGNLVLSTGAGDLTQQKPVVYQQIGGRRREVSGRFIVKGGDVSFGIGRYDRTAPLIIDPVLSYAAYLGGTGTDESLAVAVDSAGNAYVAGRTNSTSHGDYDAFVRKINPTGTSYIYQASFGGNADDAAYGVAVDASGNIFLAGRTLSPDFPNPAGAFQKGNGGGSDAFLLRVNPNTNQLFFSTYFGGSGDDRGLAVALDTQGNAYMTGSTTSTDLQTSNTAFQHTNAGGVDAFVVKFDPTGIANYGTYFGGNADDRGYGIAADAVGNVYLVGSTDSDNLPLTGAGQISRAGNTDAFITKMDTSGSTLLFSTYLGGGGSDIAQGIALDSGNNVYVTGSTSSGDFPFVQGSYSTSNAGGSDIFVTKIGPDGRSLVYSTYIGSHGDEFAYGIAVDAAGQAYITGSTNSDQFPVTADAQQKTRSGGTDVVVVKLNQQGSTLIYSTFLGGSNDDSGRAVAVDGTGNIYVAGITASRNFPATGQSVQPGSGGGDTDGFIAKIAFPSTPATINAGGIVNGGSFTANQVSPGSLFTIFGTNFGSAAISASSTPLPTSLGGVSVTVNGIAAPLVYVGTNQINAQLPYEIQPGNATAIVTGPGGASASTSFAVQSAAPGLFTGNGRAIVQNQDGSLNTPSNPAKVGSVIVAYFTGQGPLNNRVATGAVAPGISNATSSPLSATIGGANSTLNYVGLTPGFVGLAQANIVVPSLNTGDYPLMLNIGGSQSNSALVAVSSF